MGNCLRRQDSFCGSLVSTAHMHGGGGGEINGTEKDRLLGGGKMDGYCSREVKIILSKKELERLVRDMDMQGLTLEQGLARLVDGGDVYEAEHRRPWKPKLQSIPEVN
ncbi:hypothetical protein HRI_003000200 [Hibiscus trionum]|uniref:Uncharacterized protein n=1 Tax=Hibiscus trionum TaxID=183268 RepID=A0A9W7IC49_HIBTR|nr:hypothetical protein HRI_003000200 [Hibiscus trionum]